MPGPDHERHIKPQVNSVEEEWKPACVTLRGRPKPAMNKRMLGLRGRGPPGLLQCYNRGNWLPVRFSKTFAGQLWYYELLDNNDALLCMTFQKQVSCACHKCLPLFRSARPVGGKG
jgi:hypothetical protein